MSNPDHPEASTETVEDKIRFASYFKPWMILLRGKRGLAIDLWLVEKTGW